MHEDLPKTRSEAKEKEIKQYYTGKECINGHLDKRQTSSGRCFSCNREALRKIIDNNPEYFRSRSREYCRQNKETNLKRANKWAKENKDRANLNKRKYLLKNPEKVKKQLKKYFTKKRQDPIFRLNEAVGAGIYHSLKNKKGGRRWKTLVKFTIDQLIEHLEKQFRDGMMWENYGWYWHLDHIKPKSLCSSFEETWELTNLQPLLVKENLLKNNRYIGNPTNKIEVKL